MRSKKIKPKVGGKRKKATLNHVPSDVIPSTSLPPLVGGQLRCFLRVTVSRVLWIISKPPLTVIVRLRWWGESSGGTNFFPQSGPEQGAVRTTARYAIRCGPKQFTSYLTDMGTLVLEALTKPDHFPIGRVQIAGIAQLSLSHSISGFFTLVSPTSEKLGEVQVSLALEPLTDAYDSSNSVSTTDMSVNARAPEVCRTSKHASHSEHFVVRSSSPHVLISDGKKSNGSSLLNTPRGKDHVYFQTTGSNEKDALSSEIRSEQVMRKPKPSSGKSPHEELSHVAVQGFSSSPQSPDADCQNSKDILSVLLDRGSKLRNAMVVSALKSTLDSEMILRDIPLPVPKDNITAITALPSVHSSGKLLQDLLRPEPSLIYPQEDQHSPEEPSHIWVPDTEKRAIELLLGSPDGLVLPFWDGEGSPPDLSSGASSVCGNSELGDPHYDQSLLEKLFYRAPLQMLDTSSNDFVGEKDSRTPGKKQNSPSGREEMAEHPRESDGKNSVGLVQEDAMHNSKTAVVPSLSLDQIAMLGQVRMVRVLVHTLNIPTETPPTGNRLHPLPSWKCTYFVEYSFPVASAKHDGGPITMTKELTRLASSKADGGVVSFQQHGLFQVQFISTTIEHWWNTELTFTIYSRKGSQKKPLPIGKAIFPLRSMLQSNHLSKTAILPVLGLEGGVEVGQKMQDLGSLKVTLEMDVGKKSFPSVSGSKAPSQLPQHPSSPHEKTALLSDDLSTPVQSLKLYNSNASVGFVNKQRTDLIPVQDMLCPPPHSILPVGKPLQQPEENSLLLHVLLMIPNGRDFSCGPAQTYLMCKLFGTDESSKSAVSWGQTYPTFNFIQVAPVTMTSRLLERMKNNVMVIEVWQKRSTFWQDRLLGLVKLPLHQFYVCFRDPKISHLLLRAQYPVVGVDSYMPVVDVSSGSSHGHLQVLLAMGLAEQIASLQQLRGKDLIFMSQPIRPLHLLDPGSLPEPMVNMGHSEVMTEHMFQFRVERVKGLVPLQSTVWGEADCYVQYTFPAWDQGRAHKVDPHSPEKSADLIQFRTATTLCVPDPVFNHSETHALLTPVGVPIQRLLLHSFSGHGTDARPGIQFEVWCRYYYPSVRDQLVAKGLLPLSKLCAMVTMQGEGQIGPQVFSLPLVPRTESSPGYQPQPSGLIDVSVHYKHRSVRTKDVRYGPVALQVVMLAIHIHRAAGLQAAMRAMARHDSRFQYYSNVGVNSYIVVELSFLPESERRSTRVVAQSFCPEFEHHMEIPCSLLTHRVQGETCSLAELLDGGTAIFTVYHQESHKVDRPAPSDTVLGTVKVQLTDLVHKSTGISGWFPLYWPQSSEMFNLHHSPIGGLQLSINFAHHSDREWVISSARDLGWEVDGEEQEKEEEGLCSDREQTVSVAVSIPRLWVPLHCLQLPGQVGLERSTYCYFRYKLYDMDAFCSPLKHPSLKEEHREGYAIATMAFRSYQTVELRSTPPLHWYLLEETLEIQVWVAFGKHKRPRPHDTDRLVGSAYVDLSSLAKRGQQKLTLTGVYPLFKCSAPDLSGAALRVHITMTHNMGTSLFCEPGPVIESEGEHNISGLEDTEEDDHPHAVLSDTPNRLQKQISMCSEIPQSQKAELNAGNTFAVCITVERAMHLSLKGNPLVESNGAIPSCCVLYSTTDSSNPIMTPVVQDSDCPVWDHQQESRLSKQLLLDPQQTLVFKVWHKGDVERVIGFASVDLSPLLVGFQSVCGWYNITDFNGQCQGQLKVSVSPLEDIQDLQALRKKANDEDPKDSAVLFQPSAVYHTSAMYNTFPTHISRYPEQRIISSPDQQEALFSGRSSVVDRHEEHVSEVRMYHQNLSEGQVLPHGCSAEDTLPSSSALLSALRKNLSELDDIQKYFSRKLSAPVLSGMLEEDQSSWLEGHIESQANAAQLLLKSDFLVGEVRSLYMGIQGNYPQTSKSVFSDPIQSEDKALPTAESKTTQVLNCQTLTEHLKDRDSPSPSVPENYEVDSELFMDDEGKSKGSHNEGVEEDEEEYEETVIEPRTLNEVASVTDKTSPWTSVISEPDLTSLESLEESEEAPAKDCPQGEPCSPGTEEDQELKILEHEAPQVSQLNQSTDKKAQSLLAEEASKSASLCLPDQPSGDNWTVDKAVLGQDEDSEEDFPKSHVSESILDMTANHSEIACSPREDKGIQLLDRVGIPNFFLPVHNLEASMRALHLAPVFPTAHPTAMRLSFQTQRPDQPGLPFRRAPRPRLNMSSTNNEETKRIAKIFASHFPDDK
ncbi:C2 domain-containing protein 3 isoform X2 [Scleropages formosus]|uniref:C2 domain-containing protein 3 isoform X2 n=1 Tax=Scleropages formosus TaxID=113540 RepID=UPI0010FA9E80|nr:C2 domain-containing protein 3 isoform X2 [Scleropages formosus]